MLYKLKNNYLEKAPKSITLDGTTYINNDTILKSNGYKPLIKDPTVENAFIISTSYTEDDENIYEHYKWKTYEEAQKEQEEAENNRTLTSQEKLDLFADLITVEDKPDTTKEGYMWIQKAHMNEGVPMIMWELVEDPNYVKINDGSDYTKPITYKDGMSVSKGLWYTDGTAVWECVKDGNPNKFGDTEFFDVVE